MVDSRFVCCRCEVGVRNIERIFDADSRAIVPAYETAAMGGAGSGEQSTVVHAARDVKRAAWHSHEATMGTVAIDATVDDGAHLTIGDIRRTIAAADKSGTELLRGVYIACHLEVTDGSATGVAERRTTLPAEDLRCRAFCEGKRVAVAVEYALERVVRISAHHDRRADVRGQLHVLAAIAGTLAYILGKHFPIFRFTDDVGVGLGACALPRPSGKDRRDGNIATRHNEPIAVIYFRRALKIDPFVIGILDDNVLQLASLLSHRDGLARVPPLKTSLPTGTDLNRASAHG